MHNFILKNIYIIYILKYFIIHFQYNYLHFEYVKKYIKYINTDKTTSFINANINESNNFQHSYINKYIIIKCFVVKFGSKSKD